MKKIIFYLISILLCSSGITACETDEDFVQEYELIITSDTTLVSDTIILPDTTILEGDTIIKNDTIINNNSIISQDTINYSGLDISYYMGQGVGYSNIQGADCYGDHLFQFVNTNSKVFIYNLEEKTLKDIVIEALVVRVPEIGAVCEIQILRRAYSASYSYFPQYY